MSTERRRRLTLATALVLVGLTAGSASAHVSFATKAAKADADVSLSLRVPGEHAPAYTTRVVVEVPAGFDVRSCKGKPGWTCTVTPDTSAGRSALLTLNRRGPGSSGVDHFTFLVHTPNRNGPFRFEATQTYNTGTKEFWDGDAGSEHPAAVLTLSGAHAVVPSATPSSAPSPTAASTATPTASEVPVDHTGHETSDDDGFPVLPFALGGLVVVGAAAALLLRSRRP